MLSSAYAEEEAQLSKWRSRVSPEHASVETLGDRWSLLIFIIRDMMLRGLRTLQRISSRPTKRSRPTFWPIGCGDWKLMESSPPNVIRLTDVQDDLLAHTKAGIDLAPVLTEMVLWSSRARRCGQTKASLSRCGKTRRSF